MRRSPEGHLDGSRIDQAAHGLLQREPLLGREPATGLQDAKPPGQLMLGLLPLVLGHNDVEIWVQDKMRGFAPITQLGLVPGESVCMREFLIDAGLWLC
jgi:hypothetical protein